MKQCNICKIEKDEDSFSTDSSAKDKLQRRCKSCSAKYYQDNKEKLEINRKEYRRLNKENKKQYDALYRITNKERLRKQDKQKWINKKDSIKLYKKEYYLKNKEILSKKQKQYYKNNSEKIKKCNKYYKKNRIKKDINYKLSCYIRSRISHAFKNKKKSGSAIKDLGCSVNFLRGYLEVQFWSGMTWDNYGKWHVDHIRPLSSFNLENREEFLQAIHFQNLQSLWAKDNFKKGDKL